MGLGRQAAAISFCAAGAELDREMRGEMAGEMAGDTAWEVAGDEIAEAEGDGGFVLGITALAAGRRTEGGRARHMT